MQRREKKVVADLQPQIAPPRVRRAGDVLDRDLSSFAARAELWAVLHAHGRL